MDTLAVKSSRDGGSALVHRRHDLSGTDYEPILPVDPAVATAIVDRGAVAWSQASTSHAGRPGVVLVPSGSLTVTAELRADMADPTTVMASAEMDALSARSCVPVGSSASLDWVVPPPR